MLQNLQTILRELAAASLLALPLGVMAPTCFAQGEEVVMAAEATPQIVSKLLSEGQALEGQHRWGDALSLYEGAVRKHPSDRRLKSRFDVARMHYSVERRYVDRSFLESVSELTEQQSSDLYSELLLKVDSHYVVDPPWQSLAERGVAAVDVALTKTTFLRHNGIRANSRQIAKLRRAIYQPLQNRTFRSRQEVVAVAEQVGRIATQQIGLRPTATALEFTAAAAGGLDRYSAFLTGLQLKDIYSQIEGNFVGLGVELKAAGSGLEIVHVIPGSPAERAKILSGDVITKIDGKSIARMSTDEAAGLLTGEEGTFVRVRVVPPTDARTPWEANIRREHVDVPSLEDVDIIDAANGVAYVKVPVFQKTTASDLEKALWDLHEKGMRSLVIDLRGNPGGLLTSSVELADKFVSQGRIVSTRGRSSGEDFDYRAHRAGTWRVPLVVLIDDQSASASEIFAAAIHDNQRGTVVGERSFGKGSVQGIFPLGYAGAGIRLTTAKFYSPDGQPISNVGVVPNIAVQNSPAPKGTHVAGFRGAKAPDAALDKAIEIARDQRALR